MAFQKGSSGNPGGRRKGSMNKATVVIKTAIEGAFKELGGRTWLVEQAKRNPEAFMTLLGKIIPRDLSLEHNVGSSLEDLIAASYGQPKGETNDR